MPRKRKGKVSVKVKNKQPDTVPDDERTQYNTDDQQTLALFIEFQTMFLEGEALRRMLHYFSCSCSECDQDNLTDVTLKMMCTPLDLRLTKVGLNPFKDNYMYTLPYSEMTKVQKNLICESVTKDIAFSRSVDVLANMNGGVCMRLKKHDKATVFIPQERLLRALADCVILDVVSHTAHTRWLIFTIVLQRVMSKTQLERSAVERVSVYAVNLRNGGNPDMF
jgi:hypothetical protein